MMNHLSSASVRSPDVHLWNVLSHRMRLAPGENDSLFATLHSPPSTVLQCFAEQHYARYLLVRKAGYVLVIRRAGTVCAHGMRVGQL